MSTSALLSLFHKDLHDTTATMYFIDAWFKDENNVLKISIHSTE